MSEDGKPKRSFATPEDYKTPEEKELAKQATELHPAALLLRVAKAAEGIDDSLKELVAIFKGVSVKTPVAPAPATPAPVSEKTDVGISEKAAEVSRVLNEWSDVIKLEESSNFVIVRLNKQLEKEDFAKIAEKVKKELNGTWVSAGRDSRFEVPKSRVSSESTPQPTPSSDGPIENAKVLFTQELESMLSFTETEKYVEIRPRQYLGSENFAKIAAIVRDAGGEYISAGKESHFRVPK